MEINYIAGEADMLWKTGLLPVYLFFGEEDRLKDEAVSALIRRVLSEEFADFDLETLEASSAGSEEILAATGQIPFGSERRLIVVKGMEQWRDRGKQAEVERLADGIGRLADTACLVLVAAAEEEEEKRKTGISVKLDNAVKKAGAVVACRALKGEAVAEWIARRARAEGKRIAPDAVAHLVETVGSELLFLEQEILKLVSYVGERETVQRGDVERVTASSPEDVVFMVVDAICRKQTEKALVLLDELHRYDPKPQAVAGKLLALLARQYRMLWQAKYLAYRRIPPREARNLPPEIAAELPGEGSILQIAFKAGELMHQARDFSWEELADALELLLLCDLANKGGATEETDQFGGDPVGNLQRLVMALTGVGSRN